MNRSIRLSIQMIIAIVIAGFGAHAQILGRTEPTKPQQLFGQATVIDGDTLEIHGYRIRIFGIDAPESTQWCVNGAGAKYACGRQFAFDLADYIGRKAVDCVPTGESSYDRLIARCETVTEAERQDLGAFMVGSGRAAAYRRYSRDYIAHEDAARSARRGLWSGAFVMPWDFRAQAKQRGAQ